MEAESGLWGSIEANKQRSKQRRKITNKQTKVATNKHLYLYFVCTDEGKEWSPGVDKNKQAKKQTKAAKKVMFVCKDESRGWGVPKCIKV